MIKSVDFPNRTFTSKDELFAELKANKEDLINLKRAKVKNADGLELKHSSKTEAIKGINLEDGYIYAVINTTKYMDSHSDVHMDGIWNKSVKEQQGKIFYLADHALELEKVIAFPKDVSMQLDMIDWKELGLNIQGQTQALIFKVAKDKIRLKSAKEIIEENITIEHSVRMQYVKLFLCINNEDEGYKEEKANWDTYSPFVVNKEEAEENGYFWAVTDAKIYKEGSMVLAGSNDITPLLQKEIEAVEDTSKDEPLKDTQKVKQPQRHNTIFY
jgi:hypothetical protein